MPGALRSAGIRPMTRPPGAGLGWRSGEARRGRPRRQRTLEVLDPVLAPVELAAVPEDRDAPVPELQQARGAGVEARPERGVGERGAAGGPVKAGALADRA